MRKKERFRRIKENKGQMSWRSEEGNYEKERDDN